jgi:alkylated DNA repair dioxygenase AlkB
MNLNLENANVTYYPQFATNELSEKIYDQLYEIMKDDENKKVTKFDQDGNEVGEYKLNRKTAVFVEHDIVNTYVIPKIWGNDVIVNEFTPELLELKLEVEKLTGYHFNICLVNFYKTGKNCIGWHSDDEEKGSIECIASFSLGAEREFAFRKKGEKDILKNICLENSSLIIMDDGCQHQYEHCVIQNKEIKDVRINITFRHFKFNEYSSIDNVKIV